MVWQCRCFKDAIHFHQRYNFNPQMFVLRLHKRRIIDQLKQSNHDFFLHIFREERVSLKWNAGSCFGEMLLCLTVFHPVKASERDRGWITLGIWNETEFSHPRCKTEFSFRIHPFWPYSWIHEPLLLSLVSSTALVKANYDLFYSCEPTVAHVKMFVSFQCRY